MQIYDIHTHLGKTSSGEDTSPARMVAELAAHGISKIGVSTLTGPNQRAMNDTTHAAMVQFPGVIEGYAFIHPKAADALAETDRCLGELGMNGVKFHSWKGGYYPDNARQLLDVLDLIASYGVHVQTHVGTAPLSTPYVWAEYARAFPAVNFVFTHTGYYEFGLSTIEAVRDLDNVWVETSGQMDAEVLRRSISQLGASRVCFGTDWAYKPVHIEISKFAELSLTDSQREQIFWRNAAHLWRMS